MEEDKIKKILIAIIVFMVLLILFVVMPWIFRNTGSSDINKTTNEMFKEQTYDNDNDNSKKETVNNEEEEGGEEEEEETSKKKSDNSDIKRDLSDPFYAKIKERIEDQKYSPEIYIPRDYIPGDNYVKNAAYTDGSIHVFKKQPILIYVPRNEYYDAITQAFVTYNHRLKGLITFNTVKNPNKAQIKIVMTDNFGNQSDIGDAIGLGRPLRFDKNGNIIYSEIYLLTKDNYSNGKMPLIIVYNTMLHELGHALGIMGHSQDEGDLMYKAIAPKYQYELMDFSDRDIETFKVLYSNKKYVIDNALRGAKREKLEENIKYAEESNDADSYLQVAASYYDMGEYSKALDAYKKALELNPDNYRIYWGLSLCYARAKQYDYALTYGKHALKRAQTNEQKGECYHIIGAIYMDMGKYNDAYPYLNNALLMDGENPTYFINYLAVCGALNRKDLASDAYNRYINNYNTSSFSNEELRLIEWAKD
ncbi:tetratricopeptide repeat protein [bacterium]|nr:tetratricopeptide repeat protein [bacterium]